MTMNSITYILADTRHSALLVDMRVDFMTDHWGKQDEQTESNLRTALSQFFESEMQSNTYLTWLAFDGTTCVAAGGMKIIQKPGSFRLPDGKTGYIMNMYTIPAYRRKGIATEILNKLLESGRAMGIKLFELHATQEGEPVYIKEGFQKHPEPTYRKWLLS